MLRKLIAGFGFILKDVVIDGREDDCLPLVGNCSMQIEAGDVSLINARLASTLEAGCKLP